MLKAVSYTHLEDAKVAIRNVRRDANDEEMCIRDRHWLIPVREKIGNKIK